MIRNFFWFDLFLGARAEILKKFRWYFGQNDDTKRTFWNKLDFSHETTNATSGNHPSWQQLGTLLGNKVLKKFPNKSWSSSLIFFKWKKKEKERCEIVPSWSRVLEYFKYFKYVLQNSDIRSFRLNRKYSSVLNRRPCVFYSGLLLF